MPEKFLGNKFSRREMPKYVVGYAAAIKTIFLVACSPDIRPTSSQAIFLDETGLFPQGKYLDQTFFSDEIYRKLTSYSQSFPEVSVKLTRSTGTRIEIVEPAVPQAIVDKSRIRAVTFAENEKGNLVIQLEFRSAVFFGKEFEKQSPASPLVVFSRKDTHMLSGGADYDLDVWSRTGETDGRLGFMLFRFPMTMERIFDTDLIIIFNKGLLNHQGNSPVPLPVKFKIIPPSKSVA